LTPSHHPKKSHHIHAIQQSEKESTETSNKSSENPKEVSFNHIAHVANNAYYSPHCSLNLNGHMILALVDTGAEISAIDHTTCTKLNLDINSSTNIDYFDINGNKATTRGTTHLTLFGKLSLCT
jgi:predicted aspartyl protease